MSQTGSVWQGEEKYRQKCQKIRKKQQKQQKKIIVKTSKKLLSDYISPMGLPWQHARRSTLTSGPTTRI